MKKILFLKNHTKTKGFTLVELMVALTLFTIVVLALISTLFTVNQSSRKIQATRVVMDNLNFAVESISRTVRTSTNIICGGQVNALTPNCPFENGSPSAFLAMTSSMHGGQVVEYRLAQYGSRGVIERKIGSTWAAITAPEIDVDVLEFYVKGALPTDNEQPSVIVFIAGSTTVNGTLEKFSLQTMVSQRSAE